MTIDEIVGLARKAKSLMARDELFWLCSLAQQAPDGLGVEVGVYCGASLIAWTLARGAHGTSVGVDNWSYRDIANLAAKCSANLKEANVVAVLIDGDSAEAVQQITDPIAFCFIDGDHTKNGIEKDIEVWLPKISSGGVVVFHDYGRHKNACYVTEAVSAWQAKARWIELGKVETTIGFRKP